MAAEGAFYIPTANAGGDAPQVDDGLALVRFDGLELRNHPDWAGTDKFGKADNGDRFHFLFTLMASLDEVQYDPESEGDPIELDALTRTATGERSNFAALMGGILKPAEFAAWQAATAAEPFDGTVALGRVLNAKIAHSKKGWPFVESIIGIAKGSK